MAFQEREARQTLVGSGEAELRRRLEERALSRPRSDFHVASRTHLFFAPWFVPFGAKGVGDFPDEAFIQFRESVRKLLASASLDDLRLWQLMAEQADEHADNYQRTVSTSDTRQIGLSVPKSFKALVERRANAMHDSLNQFCERTLETGLQEMLIEISRGLVRSRSDLDPSRLRLAEKFNGESISFNVRISRDLKNRLTIAARTIEAPIATLSLALLEKQLASPEAI
jgi:predicted HicB family RNase H-like nuclease